MIDCFEVKIKTLVTWWENHPLGVNTSMQILVAMCPQGVIGIVQTYRTVPEFFHKRPQSKQ